MGLTIVRAGQNRHATFGNDSLRITEANADSVASWWLAGGITAANCIAAYKGKNAASKAASQINLANPGTYNLVENGTVTWAAPGWTGFTAGNYWDTGIVSPVVQTWSMFARFTGAPLGLGGVICGAVSSGGFYFMLQPSRGDGTVGYFNGGIGQWPTVLASGSLAVAGGNGYRNGVLDTAAIPLTGGGIGTSIFIGGFHDGASNSNPFTTPGVIEYASIYDTIIAAPQVTALYAATA